MQTVAAELRHSETAFVHPLDAAGRYGLRWFTPAVEVDLCGHATLAARTFSAEAVKPLTFETRSGPLTTTVAQDGTVDDGLPGRGRGAGRRTGSAAQRHWHRADDGATSRPGLARLRSLDPTTSRGCDLTCPYSRRWSAAG